MEYKDVSFRRLDPAETEKVKELFKSVFCAEPWNDDWSDGEQLDAYIKDLMCQNWSLSYGLFEGPDLTGLAMGHIKHWYAGTEYLINEFCIRTDRQGKGLGSLFLSCIEDDLIKSGIHCIYLQTDRDVPAFGFYRKNGFTHLEEEVALYKVF